MQTTKSLFKFIVALSGFMPQRVDDFLIQQRFAGNQMPKVLTAKLNIVAFFGGACIFTIAAAINGDDMYIWSGDAASLIKILRHLGNLRGVAPVWPALDRNDISLRGTRKFQIYAFSSRFLSTVGMVADMDGQPFEKRPEQCFLL
ncbi:MAG: hypothetical protein JM57_02235 [Comamonadaceae bacterium BICA1-1]|nr:MAG: hypothetical protein JM57_02235 [Comamonadaceae bacterium BICA1-1]